MIHKKEICFNQLININTNQLQIVQHFVCANDIT